MKKLFIRALAVIMTASALLSMSFVPSHSDESSTFGAVITAYAASAPKKINGLKLSSSTPTSLTVSWNKVKNADGYTLYSYNAKTKKLTKIRNTKKTVATVNGLTAGKIYRYAVKAYSENSGKIKYSKASDIISVKTSQLKKISGLGITTGGKSKCLTLSWKKQNDVTGYQIFRSTTGKSNSYTKIATVSSKKTSYTDKALNTATTYFYAVRAYKKNSDSSVNYSEYKYIDLSTVPTRKSIAKKLVKARNVYNKYLFPLYLDIDLDAKAISGKVDGYDVTFYRVKDKLKTKKNIEKELSKYFTPKSSVKSIVNKNFIEKNGKLYVYDLWNYVSDDFPYATKWTLETVYIKDKEVKMHFYGLDEYIGYPSEGDIIMKYEEGRWKLDLTNSPFNSIFFEDMKTYVDKM